MAIVPAVPPSVSPDVQRSKRSAPGETNLNALYGRFAIFFCHEYFLLRYTRVVVRLDAGGGEDGVVDGDV